MAFIGNVIAHLRPNGGWVCRGTEYEDIEFMGEEPAFSKEEFLAAFAIVDELEASKKQAEEAAKSSALAKLTALGLTPEEIATLKK
jgi:hypothetical protein